MLEERSRLVADGGGRVDKRVPVAMGRPIELIRSQLATRAFERDVTTPH